jgi:hypothetical protein
VHNVRVPLPIPVSVGEELASYREDVIAACTEASLPRRCVATSGDEAEARITVGSAPHAYRVAVWREGRWLSRQLVFADVDAMRERARALGVTAGVLAVHEAPEQLPEVQETASSAAAPAPTPPEPAGADLTPPPRPRDERAERAPSPDEPASREALLTFRGELAALGGNGIDRVRAGVGGSVAVLLRRLGVGPFVAAIWTGSSADEKVTARWASGGGGLLAVVTPADGWRVDARVGYFRERWRVVAAATPQLEEESASRLYDVAHFEVGGAVRVAPPGFVRIGVGLRTSPAQRVRVAGRELGNNPSPAAHASLGFVAHF